MRKVVDTFTIGTELAFGAQDPAERAALVTATNVLGGYGLEVHADVYDHKVPPPDPEGRRRRWATGLAHLVHTRQMTVAELRADAVRLRLTEPGGREVFSTLPEDPARAAKS